MSLETELKFLDVRHAMLRAALEAVGAVKTAEPYFEENVVFDDASHSLRSRGVLLRLRMKRGLAVLTVKRPPAAPVSDVLKVYEEYETDVGDFEQASLALGALGYAPAFRYEKVREKWRAEDVTVCLDLLPFGEFAELEGSEEAVLSLAHRLGLDRASASKANYHELNRAYRSRSGLLSEDSFVFPEEMAARLRRLYEG